jgi:hypothetical protein
MFLIQKTRAPSKDQQRGGGGAQLENLCAIVCYVLLQCKYGITLFILVSESLPLCITHFVLFHLQLVLSFSGIN